MWVVLKLPLDLTCLVLDLVKLVKRFRVACFTFGTRPVQWAAAVPPHHKGFTKKTKPVMLFIHNVPSLSWFS